MERTGTSSSCPSQARTRQVAGLHAVGQVWHPGGISLGKGLGSQPPGDGGSRPPGAEGISSAPAAATPLTAVASGLERAAEAMGPFNRELAPRLQAVIATSTELQERSALKQVGLAAAMAGALRARGVPDSAASLAAELGVLAFKEAYTTWLTPDNHQELGELTRKALDGMRTTVTELG